MGKKAIAILHGYYSSPLFMKGIEKEIKSWDIFNQVLNLNAYGKIFGVLSSKYNVNTPIVRISDDNSVSIQNTIVEHVRQQLKEELNPEISELYLLGHSMGGLVWRAFIKSIVHQKMEWDSNESPEIKGLIQLATPNQGTNVTNMKIVQILDRIHIILHYKLIGKTANFIQNLIYKFGLLDEISKQNELSSTQIQQMMPGSSFLRWLNKSPTFVNKIPHFNLIGTQNNFFFTNLAWIENYDTLDTKEFMNKLQQEIPYELQDNLDQKIFDDNTLEDKYLSEISGNFLKPNSTNKGDFFRNFKKLLKKDDIPPNDGLVSLENAKLPGVKIVDLSPYSDKISHIGICLWYLPFKPYKHVRNQVKIICEKLTFNGFDQTL